MSLRKLALTLGLFLGSTGASFAAYTITRTDGGNNTLLVQGRDYSYVITNTNNPLRFEDVFITLNNPAFDILVAPGVQTGPNKYSVDGSGQLVINIRFHNPATYSLTVTNSQDGANKGILNGIQVQRYPVTFAITPSNPTVNANVPFNIDVTALDTNGVVVTAYEDPVQIRDSQLNSLVGFVNGSSFVNGTASNVPVTVKAGNMSNQFRLTLTGTEQYYDPALPSPNLSANPSLLSNLLNLIPGAYAKLVMTFPGETLSPGIGKTGAATAQQSGVPVSLVEVRRVDSFYNPILTNPSPAVNVGFTSSQAGVDNPPFPFTLVMSGPLLSITAAMNQIYFGGSGDRIVKATPNGVSAEEDSSLVPSNPGAAESYLIELPNTPVNSTIDTDTPILVRIRAFDQNGQPLTTLFGQVPGAELRALLGNGQENRSWIDTDAVTLIPDNTVFFNAGVATMNLIVTKFGSDVQLHYVTPNRDALSYKFNVDVGAPNRVHFTIRGKAPNPVQGESWTPGTYPGNAGTPPTVKVGEEVVVEARITDRHWNLISGGGAAYTMQLTHNLPQHYIEARHVTLAGPLYQFPNAGEFNYDSTPAFDRSFRVKYRTAGPSAFTSAPRFAGTTSLGTFLSSTATVNPEAYSKLVVVAPGETLVPGIDTQPDGKTGNVTAQSAGIQFNVAAHATDLYFNPVINSPFPTVDFSLSPALAGSFVSGTLPVTMLSGSRNFSVTLASGTNITLFDNGTPAINQVVSVPIIHGPLDHFRMALNTVGNKEAGVPFSVTITAEDQYNNTVLNFNNTITLTPNTGATTMSPTTAALSAGVFNGNLTVFAATPTARIAMTFGSVSSQSPTFTVIVNSQGYRRLLSLLPGETMVPGTANGKIGSPTPAIVGTVSIIRAIACDLYFNPLFTTGLVSFSSNHLSQFGAAQGNLNNVDGHGEYSTTLILKNATTHTIVLRDVNLDGTVSRSTSSIVGVIDPNNPYKRIQLLAPGETNDPDQVTGKTGAPLAQKVSTPFTLTMRTVDDFWNPISYNGGDTYLSANIPEVIFNPPNNNGGLSPRPYTNGVATRQAIIGKQGLVTLSVRDDANLTKPGQNVDVQADPGPVYVFQTSPSAVAGQPFPAVTITLEENGVPVAGYNESIYLTADLVSGGPASGAFNPDGSPREYVMNNGAITINDLSYAYSENIKIHLTDGFGRLAFSNAIDVVPSGLKYRVLVPTGTVVAGPPASFPVRVELIDQNTNTLVKNHDHAIDISVVSAVNPTTNGSFTITSANLAQGVATFFQSYTKAESILIQISESATAGEPNYVIPSQNSNNVNLIADGYKKLLVIAPGETHVPGVISVNGKTGVATARQKGVPFLMQVRGVDQYWNEAQNFSGGQITFDSNDLPPSLGASNPPNQGAPLVNGQSASFITMNHPGTITVTVRDASNSNIGVQSVDLNVGGLYYQVDVITNPIYAGPSSPFTMNVTLFDSITNLPVTSANQQIAIEARFASGSPADGNLGVTTSQLVNGTVGITNQSYSIADNIFLYVTDANGNTGSSPVITINPLRVNYVFETPLDATVNTPFTVTIRTFADIGTPVRNLTRVNSLAAYSGVTGALVAGFSPTSVTIQNGVAVISAIYNTAEPIFLRMTDSVPLGQPTGPMQPTFDSSPINVHPGALANIQGIADFTMQSNETRTFHLICSDTFGNRIPSQTLVFKLNTLPLPGQLAINSQTGNAIAIKTNGQGEVDITFNPSIDVNGLVELVIADGDNLNGYSMLVNIDVLGLTRRPARALGIGGTRIPVGSTFDLDQNLQVGAGGTLQTYYRLNGGSWQLLDPNVGVTGFLVAGKYDLESYSVVCYPAVDPTCANAVNELTVNGAPNLVQITAYMLSESIASYPNPFNPKASNGQNFVTIQYPLGHQATVKIDIYTLFGENVWHKDIDAGQEGAEARPDNRVFWFGVNDDGHTVANGGYIVVVEDTSTGQRMKDKILVAK